MSHIVVGSTNQPLQKTG